MTAWLILTSCLWLSLWLAWSAWESIARRRRRRHRRGLADEVERARR